MKKRFYLHLFQCPNCNSPIPIHYTKKALKKILKNMGSTKDSTKALSLDTIETDEGEILVCLSSETRFMIKEGSP